MIEIELRILGKQQIKKVKSVPRINEEVWINSERNTVTEIYNDFDNKRIIVVLTPKRW